MATIDWALVRTAALAGLLILVPAAVISTLVVDDDASTAWSGLFAVITLFGFLTAGYGAGRARSDTPMMHGAAAAIACYLVIQTFGAVSRLARGDDINVVTYPLTALLAGCAGVVGALFADWYRRRALRT